MKNTKLKLTEIVESGLDKKEDLNCAETILHAANRAYKMELDKTALKLAAGFGGGMGIESTCGAITASVMVLSHLFVKEKGHESDYIKELTKELFSRFELKMNSVFCSNLKDKYKDPQTGCRPVIYEASHILENIIDRELNKLSVYNINP